MKHLSITASILFATACSSAALAQSTPSYIDLTPAAPGALSAQDLKNLATSKVDLLGVATGATAMRDIRDRWIESLDIKDDGVIADGDTDDTAAIVRAEARAQKALNAAGRVSVVFPAGRVLTSTPFVLTVPIGGHVEVRGAHGAASEIMTTANVGAVKIVGAPYPSGYTTGDGKIFVSISGLRALKASGVAAGSQAFEVIGQNPLPEVSIENMRCSAPYSSRTTPWHSCIHLVDVVRSNVDQIWSEDNGDPLGDPNQGIGVWVDATQGLYSVDNNLSKIQMTDGFAGVEASNHVEGLKIEQSLFLANGYGVYAPGVSIPGTASDASTDWIDVTHTHLNNVIRGVYAVNVNSLKVADDLFYSTDGSGNAPAALDATAALPGDTAALNSNIGLLRFSYAGVSALNSSYAQVTTSEFQGFVAPFSTAVHIDSGTYGASVGNGQGQYTVGLNTINNMTAAGILIGAGPTIGGTIAGNHFYGDTGLNDIIDLSGLATRSGNTNSSSGVTDVGVHNGYTYDEYPTFVQGSSNSMVASGILTPGQGTYVLWNHSNHEGESDFVNQLGGGNAGGFEWYQADATGKMGAASLMRLDRTGNLTMQNNLFALGVFAGNFVLTNTTLGATQQFLTTDGNGNANLTGSLSALLMTATTLVYDPSGALPAPTSACSKGQAAWGNATNGKTYMAICTAANMWMYTPALTALPQ